MPRSAPPIWLYALAVFTAAWLVFWIQPLAVRQIIPTLGGSPAVWNTAMVFFQSALLAGYALAHLLVSRASPSGQLVVLGVLWAGAALAMPAGGPRILGDAPDGIAPSPWLLATLAGAIGIGFVAASCVTPLVQAWLARSGSGEASADPYFLYAASNAGSAGALLAYPFLLEPFLSLDRQAWVWSAVLLGLGALLAFLWLASARARGPASAPPLSAAKPRTPLPVFRLLALSALPSALLLAITRYLTTDVAAVPLLWIAPLAIYLGTFVHAFARREAIPHALLTRLVAPAIILLAVVYALTRTNVLAFGLVHLLVFAVAALYCHGALARLRPPASDLTRFYLLVSTGGLLGGLLVALVAPLVFVDVYEYPIALALAAALLPAAQFGLRRRHLYVGALAVVLVVVGFCVLNYDFDDLEDGARLIAASAIGLIALSAPALLVLRGRPKLLAGALLAIFVLPGEIARATKETVAAERTFFGVYRIVDALGVRSFRHGTTLHGAQWSRADGSIESRTTYYGIGTPFSELLGAATRRQSPLVIGLVGLGTGSLACYARPVDKLIVYEIDPAVVRLARTHFAALRNCARGAAVKVGDARLRLERERAALDFLALDAFASDAIPVHLLTEEAFRIYLRVLSPDGVIAVHISNRYLDLAPVLAAVADRLGLVGRVKRYVAQRDAPEPPPTKSSTVAVLTRDEATLRALALDDGWVPLGSSDRVRVWTDDYTSIVPILVWW